MPHVARIVPLLAVAGCKIWSGSYVSPSGGDDDATGATPDADTTGTEITIVLYDDLVEMFGPTSNGQLVAVQSGDGPWVAAIGSGGVYHARVHEDRYGVAIACRYAQDESSIEIVHQTIADGVVVQRPTCTAGDVAYTIDGSIANMTVTGFAMVEARSFATGAATSLSPYQLKTVRGPTDLFVSIPDNNNNAAKVLRKDAFDVESSQTVSFDANDALPYDKPALTVLPSNKNTGAQVSLVDYAGSYEIDGFGTQTPTTYNAIPAALLHPGDLMAVEVSGGDGGFGGNVTVFTKSAAPLTVQLPAQLSDDAPVLETDDPYPRPQMFYPKRRTSLPIVRYELRVQTSDDNQNAIDPRRWRVSISDAWRAASHQGSYKLPDLSGVAGFSSLFSLQHHRMVAVFQTVYETDFAEPVDGAHVSKTSGFYQLGEWCGDFILQTNEGEQCEPPGTNTCNATCQTQ